MKRVFTSSSMTIMSMMVQIMLFYNQVDKIPVTLAETCPAPGPEPETCSAEERAEIVADFDESISELNKALAKIPDDEEDAKKSLQESICDTKASKANALDEYDKSCSNQKVVTVLQIERLKKSKHLSESERKFLQEAERETCGTSNADAVAALAGAVAALDAVQTGLGAAKDTSGEGLIFTAPATIGFAIAEAAVGIVKAILQGIIDIFGIYDDDCIYRTAKATHDVSFQIDGNLDIVQDVILPRHERKIDIIDTNNDENQNLLLHQTCPQTHSLSSIDIGGVATPIKTADVVFRGAGCDGFDNDCDSVFLSEIPSHGVATDDSFNVNIRYGLVDECDEDQVPPTITLLKEIPDEFENEDEGREWFENKDNVGYTDDCASQLSMETKVIPLAVNQFLIVVIVEDQRCRLIAEAPVRTETVNNATNDPTPVKNVVVNSAGAYHASRTFAFTTKDSIPPEVTCGFTKRQHERFVQNPPAGFVPGGSIPAPFPGPGEPLHIDSLVDGNGLVDIGLIYNAEDNSGKELTIDITLLSNELEYKVGAPNPTTYFFNRRRDLGNPAGAAGDLVHRARLFLSPFSCQSDTKRNEKLEESNSICESEINNQNNDNADFPITSRFYDIIVKATDQAGNVGQALCSVLVVPKQKVQRTEKYRKTTSGKGKKKWQVYMDTDLIEEYAISQKRHELGRFSHKWDPTLVNIITNKPTPAPTVSKGKGKGKGSNNYVTIQPSSAPTSSNRGGVNKATSGTRALKQHPLTIGIVSIIIFNFLG